MESDFAKDLKELVILWPICEKRQGVKFLSKQIFCRNELKMIQNTFQNKNLESVILFHAISSGT